MQINNAAGAALRSLCPGAADALRGGEPQNLLYMRIPRGSLTLTHAATVWAHFARLFKVVRGGYSARVREPEGEAVTV